MTDETLDPLALYAIDQVAEGRTLRDIGEELGITASAVHQRCVKTKELQSRYFLAVEMSTFVLEAEVIDAARSAAYKDSKGAKVHTATLQWILAKRNPHRYSDQVRLAHTSPDGTMSPKAAIDVKALSDSTLAELLAARKPEGAE